MTTLDQARRFLIPARFLQSEIDDARMRRDKLPNNSPLRGLYDRTIERMEDGPARAVRRGVERAAKTAVKILTRS